MALKWKDHIVIYLQHSFIGEERANRKNMWRITETHIYRTGIMTRTWKYCAVCDECGIRHHVLEMPFTPAIDADSADGKRRHRWYWQQSVHLWNASALERAACPYCCVSPAGGDTARRQKWEEVSAAVSDQMELRLFCGESVWRQSSWRCRGTGRSRGSPSIESNVRRSIKLNRIDISDHIANRFISIGKESNEGKCDFVSFASTRIPLNNWNWIETKMEDFLLSQSDQAKQNLIP